jgi:predicted Zn-dependent protease
VKRTILRLAVAAAVAVAAFATLAPAYVLLSPPRKWFTGRAFVVCMAQGENSLANSFTQGACLAGVQAWSDAVPGVPVSGSVDSSQGNIGFNGTDGQSTISFEDPQHALSTGTLAATTVGYYATAQTMVTNGTTFYAFTDADVVFNDGVDFTSLADAEQNGANGSQYDMEGIAVHEMGHAIGLAHDPVEPSTMYATFSAHDYRKRTLDDVDVNGGGFVYTQGFAPVTFAAGTSLVADTTLLGLSTATLKANSKVYVRVTVVDENGNTVSGASVSISVTRPNGTVATGTGTTSSTGRITFDTGKVQTASPGYTATVTGITKAGMTFNSAAGDSTDVQDF